MTDQLQRLRSDTLDDLAQCDAEIARLHDKAGVYRHMISRIDDMIAEGVIHEPETAAEKERREKRDIRGAIMRVLEAESLSLHTPISGHTLRARVVALIGELTDSALARSMSSLVGDCSVIERDGRFSLPAAYNLEAAK